jgi:hypothetical protein
VGSLSESSGDWDDFVVDNELEASYES